MRQKDPLESNRLVGRTIKAIVVERGERALAFDTDKGALIWKARGDCCSEAWFSDIENVAALLGGTVVSVVERDAKHDVEDGRSRQDYDEVYGYTITTNLGTSVIEFRNSSNGYYGGWCQEVEVDAAHFADCRSITEDWSA